MVGFAAARAKCERWRTYIERHKKDARWRADKDSYAFDPGNTHFFIR